MSPRAILPLPVRVSPRAYRNPNSLDTPIIRLSKRGDFLRRRDFVTNIATRGSIGSGKTTLLEVIQRAAWEAGDFGIILCAKPDSAERAIQTIRASGRNDSLLHITPESGYCFNPVDFAMKQGGALLPMDEALDELWTILEIINRGEVAAQGDNFFVPAQSELTHKGMKVLHAAKNEVGLRDLMKICERLPETFEALEYPERYFVLQMIALARKRYPVGANVQLDDAISYFTKTIPGLSDKTRSSIQISATVRLGALLEDIYERMFFGKRTNITPADIIDNRLLAVIDVPFSQYRRASRAIGAAWKSAFQKEMMRRHYQEDRPLGGVWADECACWLTDMDMEAAERGRSSDMYHAYTFQSIKTLVTGYGGGAVGESKAASLMSNFVVNIMANQIDSPTREHDQKMDGSVPTWVQTISENWKNGRGGDDPDMGAGDGGESESFTLHHLPSLPEEWLLGLESGQHGYVQAFIFVGGRKFKWNDKRWLLVRWPQNYAGWRWMEAQREKVPVARPFFGYVSPRDLWEAFKRNDLEDEFFRWLYFWSGGEIDLWEMKGGRSHA